MSDNPFDPSATSSFISLGGTLGVLAIAAYLGSALYGVTTVQTFIYRQCRERDPIAVYLLWHVSVIDTFQSICMLHLMYFYCIKNFGNLSGLKAYPWTWSAFTVMSALNGALVTGLYAHRLWKLSGNIWAILLIGVAAVLTFVGGIDLSIPRKTGLGRTGSIINLIIIYSLSTCLITSATNIAMLVTSAMLPGQLYDVGLAVLLPKLTLNSLLAMLNTRDFLKNKMYHDNGEPVSIHLSRLPGSSAEVVSGPQTPPYVEANIELGIQVEKSVIQV
ncbi:hypothetical protein BDW22DRAFT_1431102 [Trametopsis cervina]|nr:hypothetical protein BDW22DRAFT_1431102 [Trametopsis cervina]